jgi:hypothetical protein
LSECYDMRVKQEMVRMLVIKLVLWDGLLFEDRLNDERADRRSWCHYGWVCLPLFVSYVNTPLVFSMLPSLILAVHWSTAAQLSRLQDSRMCHPHPLLLFIVGR